MKNHIEEIDRYLQNELNELERKAFEDRLELDSELKQDFDILLDAKESLTNNWKHEIAELQLKQYLEKMGKEYFSSPSETKKPFESNKPKFLVFGWVKYAALLVLALGGYWFWQTSQSASTANLYVLYSTVNNISLTEKGSDNAQLTAAEIAFNNKEYPEAIRLFDEMLKADNSQVEIRFYKAIAMIEINQYSEARLILKDLSNGSSAFKEDADWYTILSFVHEKNESKATELIESLPSGHAYEAKAKELLNSL